MKYLLGTRGSRLAVAQSESVRSALEKAYPEHTFELRIISTKGDRVKDLPLDQIGDRGLFVREIEEQLLRGEIQIGVHSMKDMPALPAQGLSFARSWKREDPRDVLILREKGSLPELPRGAVIGTGSKRRRFQLLKLRPDLKIVDIRGNVDTRLRKMEEQRLDGIVLAAAGLHRLGLRERITQYLEPWEMIPAPAQGILALEVRADACVLTQLLDALGDEEAQTAAMAERGFLTLIGGDCHVPIGALYTKNPDQSHTLHCVYGDENGRRLAFAAVKKEDPAGAAREAMREIRRQLSGTVSLVGAGPGDPGLITVKGLTAIRQADCIVYDRLSSPMLLKEAKSGCEMIYVGKENHHHTMRQDDINKLLAGKALQYERVVRLKGGDVYVFGRGGEEGSVLWENGIPFEVIPGVSSCIAGPAYAGIPVTHRGAASGFHVVTAHSREDELADIDFKAMAAGKETCIFLMGLSRLRDIAEGLLRAGMPDTACAAVISGATTEDQRTVTADLGHIVQETEKAGLISPALIVVGEVAALRPKLNFYENRPGFGKRYLLPTIGAGPSRLRELLEREGAIAEEVQVGEIVSVKRRFAPGQFAGVDWLVFSSGNGVDAFMDSLFASGLDTRALGIVRLACIGDRTAERLRQYGLRADLLPAAGNGGSLKEALGKAVKPGDVVWYLKALNADGSLKESLAGHCRFEEVPVYENRPVPFEKPDEAALERYDGVFFTCASSVERLMDSLSGREKEAFLKKTGIYSIGPKSSAALRKYGIDRIIEAPQPSYEALASLAGVLK